MFTGIIEAIGEVKAVEIQGTNYCFYFRAPFVKELKIDQSVAHNGVCLTIVDIQDDGYRVDVIQETLSRTNFKDLAPGTHVNLERSLQIGARLDGHFVQGHVDTVSKVQTIETLNGSWYFEFNLEAQHRNLVVEKGSIAINGVSLTIAHLTPAGFRVAIIPYTFNHTNFQHLQVGSSVNLEFDILGKYVWQQTSNHLPGN